MGTYDGKTLDNKDISIVTQTCAKIAADLVPYANPTASGTGDTVDTFNYLLSQISEATIQQIIANQGRFNPKATATNAAVSPKPFGPEDHSYGNSNDNVVRAERAFGSRVTDGPVFVNSDGDVLDSSAIPAWAVNAAKKKGAEVVEDVRHAVGDSKKPHFRVKQPRLDKDGIWPPTPAGAR